MPERFGLAPLGLVRFSDELRPEARETLARFRETGVQLKIISGDNPQTVAALARQAGFVPPGWLDRVRATGHNAWMTAPILLLVDGSSYLYRAYHAMPDLRGPEGVPTGAIHGMVAMMKRLRADVNAEHAVCVFDAKGKTFRDDWYPEYKAHRAPMPRPSAVECRAVTRIRAPFTAIRQGALFSNTGWCMKPVTRGLAEARVARTWIPRGQMLRAR